MPISAPVSIGVTTADAGAGQATFSVTTTLAVTAGDGILLAFQCLNSGALFSSVSDAVNGTYNVVRSANTGNGFTVGIAYVLASGTLGSSSLITLTTTGSLSGYVAMRAFKEAGGLGTLDVSATAVQATATALSVGPTGATANAVELVMATFGYYLNTLTAQSFTAAGGYTALASATSSGASDQNGIYPEYLITAGTGAQTATGTLGTAPSSSAGVVLAFTGPSSETFPSGYGSPFGHAGQSQMQQLLARFSRRRWTRRTGIWLPQYA